MKIISTPNGPSPAGHYSQAVVYGGVVYVSGVLGVDPAQPDKDPGGVSEQTLQALRNVEAILDAAGSGLNRVIRVMIYASDMDMWAEINEVFADVMGDHKPARAIVPVKRFKGPYVIEIVATAALGG